MSHLHGALGFTHGDWTAGAPLPGGDMAEPDAGVFETSLRAQMPWLPPALAHRYARTYGTRTHVLVGDASSLDGLGQRICGDLYEAELRYLVQYEWARTAQDVLWRRTKLGLHVGKEGEAAVAQWFEQHLEMAA